MWDRLPSIYGFTGAFLVLTLLSYPYVLLTARAALQRMDPALEESARGLGLGPVATFFRVTLPLLRPSLGAGVLLVGLYTFSDFGAVSLLRYETFTWAIFTQYESALDRTLGAGLSMVLVVLALAWVALEFVSRGRSRYHSTSSGTERPPSVMPLGRWRWPAIGFCALVSLVSLGLPVGILIYWVVSGVSAGEPLDPLWEAARNSVYISALAALVVTAAAMPIGLLSVKYPTSNSGWGALSGLLERLGYVSFCPSRDCHRPSTGLFRRQLRWRDLPDHMASLAGIRGAVPFTGVGSGAYNPVADQPAGGGGRPQLGPFAVGSIHIRHAACREAGNRCRGIAGIPADHEGVAGHAYPEPDGLHHAVNIRMVIHLGGLLRPGRNARPTIDHTLGCSARAADVPGETLSRCRVIIARNPGPDREYKPCPEAHREMRP